MESVLSASRSEDEAALAAAVEALRVRLSSDTPPPPEEVRRAVEEIADMALALWAEPGSEAPAPPKCPSG